MPPVLPRRVGRRRGGAPSLALWFDPLTFASAALLHTAAASEAIRLNYDSAVILDGSCLAPEYAGADCAHLRSHQNSDPHRIPASAALSWSEDSPALMLDIPALLEQATEVTYGSVPPPERRDVRGRRRP